MGDFLYSREITWTPIGQTSNQLILYHPPSHALSVQPHPPPILEPGPSHQPLLIPYRSETPIESITRPTCPYCSQPLASTPPGRGRSYTPGGRSPPTAGYFEILERAHEGSRPPSPPSPRRSPTPFDEEQDPGALPAKGYYERFFREERRLGMGAEGSVYLATHVIGGNVLGTYAVKKIAVGTSQSYLVKMLREVRLLETLRHPNIIPYHHSWIDTTHFSSFGPPITALHVLMMYATAGNLDSFLLSRAHSTQPARPDLSAGDIADNESLGQLPREERIKAFRKRRQSSGRKQKEETRGILLLRLDEIIKLFGDVVEGLAFLHSNSILHLDLKCSNVLLHWEEGQLIPKAMISDFGTSQEMLRGRRDRTGHTGTMEYMAPETIIVDGQGKYRPSDSHADMWSLGLILHKLLFLNLPYTDTDDYNALQAQIEAYEGFRPTPELIRSCERRHIPRDLLLLLGRLVHVEPERRPSAEKVKLALSRVVIEPAPEGLGGLVTRFTRPFENLRRTPSLPRSETSRWDYSPVQTILALPSPEDERSEPIIATAIRLPSSPRYIKMVLLIIKILALQTSLTGIQLGPVSTAGLVALAVGCMNIDGWAGEIVSTGVILGAILAAGSAATVEVGQSQPL
ncbi:kinase-like domain-containing protein [Naematelia encephala]|uniref:non-specific serine/threonine protein kinase n=1 Tax=Naematelia encephala TaxID=71784 RepID=A0A1Y2AWG3_9TREE|nr:kinase-like domain-containing protein [Naematelia encephala]